MNNTENENTNVVELADDQLVEAAGGVGFHSIEKFTPLSTIIKNTRDLDFSKEE